MTFPKIKTHHLGIYHYNQTAEQMVVAGRNAGKSYLTIGRELNLEATRLKRSNPNKSKKYKKGARLAFKMHTEYHG